MESQTPSRATPPPPRPPQPAAPAKEKRKLRLRTWILLITLALFVIFIIQNSQKVEVNFLLVDANMPLYFALLLAGALGALIGWAISKMGKKSEPKE